MKKFFLKYKFIWPAILYFIFYMIWFVLLEIHNVSDYYSISCALDEYIPFCEYFIIPYLAWFIYIPAIFVFVIKRSKNEFYRMCAYMFTGMTICLIIYTVFPNGQDFRIEATRDNFFTHLVNLLYTADTNTNCFPSIHVFNSLSAHICFVKSSYMPKGHRMSTVSFVLMLLICLSTLFLNQHSVLDLLAGALLSFILYFVMFKGIFKNMTS